MTSIGDPMVGHVLDGRYQITRRLARGGMATVYQAVDTRLTRTVAVKVMHVGLGDDAEFARKFDREARAAAKLSHPNVVSVFDQGHDYSTDGHGSRPYIVMEYVDGRTLRDVISSESPLSPTRALELIEPVLAALASAHDAGLVHRDVKPENVLISDRGQIKVADFGLAKAISAQTSTATQGLLIGTVSYLPPELVTTGKADARADIYSTGVVLFEMLTGRKPHTGETPIQVAYAHVHNDVPRPSEVRANSGIPPYLDALVARATAREPNLRPHDARVMLNQVRRVRAALAEGLQDDPDLTQDLSGMLAGRGQGGDHERNPDLEATQMVTNWEAVTPTSAEPTPYRPTSPQETWSEQSDPAPLRQYSPPTIIDAPPPAIPDRPRSTPVEQLAAQRMAAHRRRRAARRRRGLVALLLVLLLATGALLTAWYLTEGRFTVAPPLTTLTQDQAQVQAQQAGLQIEFNQAFSESVSPGVVISTDPGAGTKIINGGQIEAVISKGPERFVAPKTVGLSRDAAESALIGANLSLGTVSQTWHEEIKKNVVVKASAEPGSKLKKHTEVDLVVSKGPKPIKIVSYTGKSTEQAKASLVKAGFLVKIKTAHSDSVPKGSVIKQTPAKGEAFKGDTITLTDSRGPVMVTVPNVTRWGTKDATKTMEQAGFKVVVKPVAVNFIGIGYVVYTNPGKATQAPKGSTITLYVV